MHFYKKLQEHSESWREGESFPEPERRGWQLSCTVSFLSSISADGTEIVLEEKWLVRHKKSYRSDFSRVSCKVKNVMSGEALSFHSSSPAIFRGSRNCIDQGHDENGTFAKFFRRASKCARLLIHALGSEDTRGPCRCGATRKAL